MKQSFLQNISNKALTNVANVFYGNPSKDFFVIVITGTNGKTTTGLILNYLINHTVGKSALFTPDFCLIGDIPNENTESFGKTSKKGFFTPTGINSFLAEAKGGGCQVAIFVFDSINISKGLLDSIDIDMGLLTNIKTENDDEIDAYKQLFTKVISNNKPNKTAVLPKDDKVGNRRYKEMVFGKVMNFGIVGSANLKADNIQTSPTKTDFVCNYLGQQHKVSTSVVGQYNINHLLSAMSAMIIIGVPIENLFPLLPQIPSTLSHTPTSYEKNGTFRYFESSQTSDIVYQTGIYCKSLHNKGNLFVVNLLDTKKTTDQLQELIQTDISLGGTTVLGLNDIGEQEIFDKLKPVWDELSTDIGNNLFYFNSKKILLNRVYKNSKQGDVVLVVGGEEKGSKEIIDSFG